MKLIKFEIRNDKILEITCKPSKFKSYPKEIKKLKTNLHAKKLHEKCYGWGFDENKNIVFCFRLLDSDSDVKPYLRGINNE